MSATIRTTQPAVCPLDCPDTCSLSVTVENGQIRGVRGSRANPYTDKAICSKVAKYYPDYVHGSQRLLYPLQRTGPRGSGQFERISWAAALDQVHAGFQRAMDTYGPQSVVGFNYAGPHGELAGGSMDRRFFHALGASCLDGGPLCGGVRSLAYTSLFGHAPGLPPEQLLHSDLILLWSSNTTVSALHLARTIRKAQENGARLVVIDPRRTTMAERADLFLQLKPDTDVVLALALAAELERRFGIAADFVAQWVHGHEAYLEQARRFTVADVESICGISAAQFRQLADWYLTAQRVGLAISNGMERGRNGGSGLRAAMALQALSGNFGRPGAGVVAKAGFAFPRNSNALQRPDLLPPDTRTLNILDVSRAILTQDFDPPVRALMIYNHNPLAVHPEQERMRAALMHEALFIAGSDVVMT
ncbi:MAG: molybdopterin-dependent oxidoreductase, partial [Thiothrix sp.]|nr:molybdopterin-dependent oxidoreductase [Thiothrix sp.]